MCLPTPSDEKHLSNALSTTDRIVPTFPVEAASQQLEMTYVTSSDLAALKRNDPFMYYSIPSVKNAALHCKDVSVPLVDVPSRRHASFSEIKSKDNALTKCVVTRQRRLSMECHPDLLMEEMLADANFMASLSQSESANDPEDDLYDFLLALHETSR
ncbi:hypothetical protein HJC23_010447 [Cyclotella cryptica]|uniref:Uncharacterized protein n=1 Tax=Cyclotella cryptica TaxID=29204 RepID=A0ABD3QHE1_9STRA